MKWNSPIREKPGHCDISWVTPFKVPLTTQFRMLSFKNSCHSKLRHIRHGFNRLHILLAFDSIFTKIYNVRVIRSTWKIRKQIGGQILCLALYHMCHTLQSWYSNLGPSTSSSSAPCVLDSGSKDHCGVWTLFWRPKGSLNGLEKTSDVFCVGSSVGYGWEWVGVETRWRL